MPTWSNIYFQNSASPLMEQMILFHDNIMFIMMMILTMVFIMMMNISMNKFNNMKLIENQKIEIIWTMIPMIILIYIAIPSLHLLYLSDETMNPSITIKIIGHQWYWSYEYSDFKNYQFDSYMIKDNNLNNFRIMDVDNRTIVPMKIYIRSLISSSDVIHAWTIPALAVKADALPSRINQLLFYTNRPGIFFGQCSEICGVNHSFMPICIESINNSSFIKWMKNF
uniref:Cytochrome c oxidase subunit 2 n=1 Tax=Ecnomus latus TaxID=623472 RepID=A0A9E8LPL7_9NEOP|nr:cytochrome c oxidase subunit II [Ecnomus latus]UZZ43898.1 cytochrome c oxidase subunit II [Ecnomus latus]